jgi:integrase
LENRKFHGLCRPRYECVIRAREAAKAFVATRNTWSNAFKESVSKSYDQYVRMNGLSWNRPFYQYSKKLPYVATSEQINKIISNCRKKYALILCILRDTGLRPIELHRLTLKGIDIEKGKVTACATKNGNPRILKVKPSTLAMLKEFVAEHDFGLSDRMFPTPTAMRKAYCRRARYKAGGIPLENEKAPADNSQQQANAR